MEMVRCPRKSNKQNWRVKIIPELVKSNPSLLKLSNGCNLVLLSELHHGFISNMNIRSWVRILMVGSGRRSEDQRIQKRSYTIWVSWLFSLYTIDRFTMGGVLSNIAVWLTTSTTKLNHTIRNLRGLEVEKIENWQGSGTCTTLEIWKVRKRHSLVIYFLVLVMGS